MEPEADKMPENYCRSRCISRQDPCTVFPVEALQSLKDGGVIGDLAENYFSCMGGIYSQNRVKNELIPNLEEAVSGEEVDLLLLVPL